MPTDLTLPGDIPGLLRRCSPVRHGECARSVVMALTGGRYGRAVRLATQWNPGEDPSNAVIHVSINRQLLGLDLSDATGRMHATWWLAEALGATTVRARTFAWQSVGGHLPGWEISSGGIYLRCYRPARVDGETGQFMWPFLAELDPTDKRHLADGFRLVDAEALRRVCLHVAGRDGCQHG